MPATVICPLGHFAGTNPTNGTCRSYSYPLLFNDVFWQNRAFYIGVGSLGPGTLSQQNVVTLFDGFSTSTPVSQTATGQCPADSHTYYWDIGVRGDTARNNHSGGATLAPSESFLTDASDYPGLNNSGANPAVAHQYCNGARVPPENGGMGYQVPPGISDATVPNPVFSLTPAATVDEGNNWININWGPLSTTNPVTKAVLGNYSPASSSSPTVNYIRPTSVLGILGFTLAPATDYFGNARKTNFAVDAGAVEFVSSAAPIPVLAGILPASGVRGASLNVTLTGTGLSRVTSVTAPRGIGVSNVVVVNDTTVTATLTVGANAPTGNQRIGVGTRDEKANTVVFTVLGSTTKDAPRVGPQAQVDVRRSVRGRGETVPN
jgi:hypothetical protein